MSENDLQLQAERRIGTVLCGKYRIDRVLGVGGMAVVYAATHRNQKRVAIKMLHPELSVHAELCSRFLREGYAANTVDHPGAVAVLDDDTAEDGSAFLVMERLEGEEVDRLWQQRGERLAVDVVLSIAHQLLDVLVVAHSKSIIHRDIKPANLYVMTDGTLKVLDFGIARVRDAASTGQAVTSTGILLGTPAYMAPEQALGKSREIDGTTDNWSVGATMFSLLSGRLVHEGETVTELVVKLATQPAPSLAAVAPHVDPRVVEIVDRALAFDKSRRWPTALAMRDAVREVYLAIFGAKIGKEPLERILAEGAAWTGATLPVDAVMTPPPVLRANPPAQSARSALPVRSVQAVPPAQATRIKPAQGMTAWPSAARAPSVRQASSLLGGSTSRPVEADAVVAQQGGAPSAVVALVVGLGAVATLLMVLGGAWWLFSRHSSATASAAMPFQSVALASASAASPPPLLVLEASAPAAVETVAPLSPDRSTTTPVKPVGSASPSHRPPLLLPSASAGSSPVLNPVSRSPAPRSAGELNCDPPYTINLSGQRVHKLECP